MGTFRLFYYPISGLILPQETGSDKKIVKRYSRRGNGPYRVFSGDCGKLDLCWNIKPYEEYHSGAIVNFEDDNKET